MVDHRNIHVSLHTLAFIRSHAWRYTTTLSFKLSLKYFFDLPFVKSRGWAALRNTWDYLCRSQCICDIAVTVIKQVHRGRLGWGPKTSQLSLRRAVLVCACAASSRDLQLSFTFKGGPSSRLRRLLGRSFAFASPGLTERPTGAELTEVLPVL